MEKRLIAFTEEQFEKINKFSEDYSKSFTESVRTLVDMGLKSMGIMSDESEGNVSEEMKDKILTLEQAIEKLAWWTSEETAGRLGNLETSVSEMQQQIKILTGASKLFKKFIEKKEDK